MAQQGQEEKEQFSKLDMIESQKGIIDQLMNILLYEADKNNECEYADNDNEDNVKAKTKILLKAISGFVDSVHENDPKKHDECAFVIGQQLFELLTYFKDKHGIVTEKELFGTKDKQGYDWDKYGSTGGKPQS